MYISHFARSRFLQFPCFQLGLVLDKFIVWICFTRHDRIGSPAQTLGDRALEAVRGKSAWICRNLYNTVLIGRIILTWFPQAPPALVGPLATVCDPYLNIFRCFFPTRMMSQYQCLQLAWDACISFAMYPQSMAIMPALKHAVGDLCGSLYITCPESALVWTSHESHLCSPSLSLTGICH